MPCKKENCKCYKCGKIADKVVDLRQLPSDSSISNAHKSAEPMGSSNAHKSAEPIGVSNATSAGNSSFVIYKQEYPQESNLANESSYQDGGHNRTDDSAWRMEHDSRKSKNKSFIEMARSADRLQDRDLGKLQSSEQFIIEDENHNRYHIDPEEQGALECAIKMEDPPKAIKIEPEPDEPVRRFSITMRDDVDKPLHPLKHHESNDDLPIVQNIDFNELGSNNEEDDQRDPSKGNVNHKKDFKKLLQSIVDSSDKILNTLDKANSKVDGDQNSKPDEDKGDNSKGSPQIHNVHHVPFDPTKPVTISIPLNISFGKDTRKRRRTPPRQVEAPTRSSLNNLKTSSESINIYFPKSSYKGLSSDLDLTEKVLTDRYKNETSSTNDSNRKETPKPPISVYKQDTYPTNEPIKQEVYPEEEETVEPRVPSIILNRSEVSNLDVNKPPGDSKRPSFKASQALVDNEDLMLPVNFPQQRDIKVCVPCYCDKCPLFDNLGNLICPEKCGCCTCAYVMSEVNPDDRTELELCRCTSKTQFNTIGRSYVQRCQCSKRVDLCPCRDKYGALGEQVPEFEEDTMKSIKKRQSSRKASLRMSRVSGPTLVKETNENTTSTTTPSTDDSGEKGNDGQQKL